MDRSEDLPGLMHLCGHALCHGTGGRDFLTH